MGAQRDLVIEIDVGVLVALVAGETGGHQALLELADRRHASSPAIQERPASLFRRKHLIAGGIKDHARNPLTFVLKRQGDTEYWITMSKIRCAIQRINIPAEVATGFTPAALLANEIRGATSAGATPVIFCDIHDLVLEDKQVG